jgi:2',3'-cyclic-nucleotide 2'-phosphodiesterase (5'-nucleotidase family)
MTNVPNINQSVVNNSGTITPKTQAVPANVSQQNSNTPNYTATIYPQETVSVYNPSENAPKLTHTSWFYINDVHGKMTNMERIYNISKEFDSTPSDVMSPQFFTNSTEVSKFKVSSGDVILGEEVIPNTVASQFLNWSGFIASALGNHELDVTKPETFAKLLGESNYKMLAANVDVAPNSLLVDKIHKSMITEKDGIKYGIICIAPPNMRLRVKQNDTVKDFTIYDTEETNKRVQA